MNKIMLKKVIKISIIILLLVVVFVSLCFGAILLEDSIMKKGVMVYSREQQNTTIMPPYDVSSTTMFLNMVEKENLYYVNPFEIGENPTMITHSYKYLDKDGFKANYSVSSSITYPDVTNEIRYVGVEVVNNSKESTLSKLLASRRSISYSDRMNLGITESRISYRKVNNNRCRIKSYINNFREEGEKFYCTVYYKQKDYQLVLGFGIDITEERDFDSLEDKCVKKAEEIVNLVKKG